MDQICPVGRQRLLLRTSLVARQVTEAITNSRVTPDRDHPDRRRCPVGAEMTLVVSLRHIPQSGQAML